MHIVMTPTGLAFDVSAPDPLAVRPADICRALANIQLAPGRLARPVCMAEVALLSTLFLQRERNIDDPWLLSCALLVGAPRAYLPLLDRRDIQLWSDEMHTAWAVLSRAIMHRFGLRETYARVFHIAQAAQATVAREIKRQLGVSSMLDGSDPAEQGLIRHVAAQEWEHDFRSPLQGADNPDRVSALLEDRLRQLERERLKAFITPKAGKEASAC